MDELGLKAPETLDELKSILKAFQVMRAAAAQVWLSAPISTETTLILRVGAMPTAHILNIGLMTAAEIWYTEARHRR